MFFQAELLPLTRYRKIVISSHKLAVKMSDQMPPKQENMDHIHVQQDGMFLRDRALTAMNQAAYRNRNPSLFSQKDSPRLSSLPKPVLVVNFKLRLFTQLCTLSFGCLSVTSYLFSNDILFGIGLLLLLPCLVGMGVIHFTNPRCTSNFEKFFIWSSFASNLIGIIFFAIQAPVLWVFVGCSPVFFVILYAARKMIASLHDSDLSDLLWKVSLMVAFGVGVGVGDSLKIF